MKLIKQSNAFLTGLFAVAIMFFLSTAAQAQSNAEAVFTALTAEWGVVETAMFGLLTIVLVGMLGAKLIKKGATRAT